MNHVDERKRSPIDSAWIWLISGLGLMALEFIAPGLVVVFMGMAAVLVAGLDWLGIVTTLTGSLATWMGLSIVLVVALRKVFAKYLPADVRRDESNEFADALGQIVDVVEPCGHDHMRGRIWYQGTSWPAQTISGDIPSGQQARLLYRNNLSWTIEPVPELPSASTSSAKVTGNN